MKTKEKIGIRGFYRLNIQEADKNGKMKVVGDSGWVENTVTNYGFEQAIATQVGGAAGAAPTHLALGTGTAPGATATTLEGEIATASDCRMAISTSVVSSKTLRMTGSLNSGLIGAASTIKNIGVWGHSSTGTVMSGNTYATSQLATNQTVNATYEWRFA